MVPSPPTDAELHTRIRQQEIAAELGQRALETDDIDRFLHAATDAVAETLDTDVCGVIELVPGADEAALRQGVGWRAGRVGDATVPTGRDSPFVDALRSERPVVVDDLRTDERFTDPELLAGHDVVSGVSAVVGSPDDPWGALGTFTTERRAFADHDVDFVRSVANLLASAVANGRAQSELEEVYGRISDAFFALDEDWRFTHLNERAHELINPEGKPLVGEHVWEAFPEAVGRSFEPAYERAMYEQETVSFEEYYPEPLDAWFEVNAYPSETGLSVYFQDVTERKEYEHELEQYWALTRAVSDVIVTIDASSTIRSVNPAVEDVFGYQPAEVVGEPLTVLLPERFRETHLDAVQRYLETGERQLDWSYVELPGLHRSGEEVPLAISFSEVEYEGERLFTGVVRDVTESREMERELRESEARFRMLAENLEEIVWMATADADEFVYVNPAFDEVWGLDREELYDDPGAFLDAIHTEDRDGVLEAFAALPETEFDEEFRIVRPDGEIRWIHVRGTRVHAEGGEMTRIVGIGEDVTERVERERRLEELVDRLEESNERLEQFAYAASHDLQEPLRMVSSYLQLIERRHGDDLDADGREFVEYAVDGADRMREMIEGLLEYSRVDTRGDAFEPVDLDDVFADVLDDLQVRIEETDAEVTAESLPRVDGDAGQLRQLFQNLLDNAIEYSGDEPPRIHVSADRPAGKGDERVISVRDEGVGIDPSDADRIFEVFQSLRGPDHAGTGIGLALCERIVERHGGEIWVESEPGEGSTFSFTLRAAGDRDE